MEKISMLIDSLSPAAKFAMQVHLARTFLATFAFAYLAIKIATDGSVGFGWLAMAYSVYMIGSGIHSAWHCIREDTAEYFTKFTDAIVFIVATGIATGVGIMVMAKNDIQRGYEFAIVIAAMTISGIILVGVICGCIYAIIMACRHEVSELGEIGTRRHASKYGSVASPIMNVNVVNEVNEVNEVNDTSIEFIPDASMSTAD